MRRRCRHLALLCAAAALLAGGFYWALTAGPAVEDAELDGRLPRIRPGYTDVVIPPNIAPLNFCIDEEGTRYHVRIHSTLGEQIEIRTRRPRVRIPLEAWRRLLNGNRGAQLCLDVYVKGRGGNWRRFDTVTNTVAPEQIDGYMVYRWIGPGYNLYEALSIRQRNLQNYEESLVLDNSSLGHACINCHTFLDHAPGKMVIQ
ncbi:MAG: hypothetical protein KAX19_10030, partial [Candidatus Brocadiae bacterium]|nr:hypothetical protein [Candidatus Brocadiia bacterium]